MDLTESQQTIYEQAKALALREEHQEAIALYTQLLDSFTETQKRERETIRGWRVKSYLAIEQDKNAEEELISIVADCMTNGEVVQAYLFRFDLIELYIKNETSKDAVSLLLENEKYSKTPELQAYVMSNLTYLLEQSVKALDYKNAFVACNKIISSERTDFDNEIFTMIVQLFAATIELQEYLEQNLETIPRALEFFKANDLMEEHARSFVFLTRAMKINADTPKGWRNLFPDQKESGTQVFESKVSDIVEITAGDKRFSIKLVIDFKVQLVEGLMEFKEVLQACLYFFRVIQKTIPELLDEIDVEISNTEIVIFSSSPENIQRAKNVFNNISIYLNEHYRERFSVTPPDIREALLVPDDFYIQEDVEMWRVGLDKNNQGEGENELLRMRESYLSKNDKIGALFTMLRLVAVYSIFYNIPKCIEWSERALEDIQQPFLQRSYARFLVELSNLYIENEMPKQAEAKLLEASKVVSELDDIDLGIRILLVGFEQMSNMKNDAALEDLLLFKKETKNLTLKARITLIQVQKQMITESKELLDKTAGTIGSVEELENIFKISYKMLNSLEELDPVTFKNIQENYYELLCEITTLRGNVQGALEIVTKKTRDYSFSPNGRLKLFMIAASAFGFAKQFDKGIETLEKALVTIPEASPRLKREAANYIQKDKARLAKSLKLNL